MRDSRSVQCGVRSRQALRATADSRWPLGGDCVESMTLRSARQRGQAAVELALVLPILALLLITAVDLGRSFYYYTSLANAVRVGAAWATSYAAGYTDTSPTVRQNQIKAIIVDSSHLNPPLATSQVDVTGTTVNAGDQADITATYTFQFITPLARSILGGDLQMRYRIRVTYT